MEMRGTVGNPGPGLEFFARSVSAYMRADRLSRSISWKLKIERDCSALFLIGVEDASLTVGACRLFNPQVWRRGKFKSVEYGQVPCRRAPNLHPITKTIFSVRDLQ
jgi:hypothetical protein